jgi:hypothetical protein
MWWTSFLRKVVLQSPRSIAKLAQAPLQEAPDALQYIQTQEEFHRETSRHVHG